MFPLASGADWPGNQTKSLPFYNVASANSQNLTSTEIPKIKKRPNGLVARLILSMCHNRPPFHLVEMSSLHSAWIPASKNANSHGKKCHRQTSTRYARSPVFFSTFLPPVGQDSPPPLWNNCNLLKHWFLRLGITELADKSAHSLRFNWLYSRLLLLSRWPAS